ncbi:glycosyltransferase, partial [Streptomyces sp. NPDC086077]|uniref:glycosyltransferase family 2 protein n=1 Tax=Streptomyces sp. NPDC086077 TaxID=3154862 RepID=UPI003424CE3C
ESVLGQSCTELELIVVDDRSPDARGEIVEEFAARDPRAQAVHLPQNRGPGPARTSRRCVRRGSHAPSITAPSRPAPPGSRPARPGQPRAAFRARFCPRDDGRAAERVVRHVAFGEAETQLPRVVPSAAASRANPPTATIPQPSGHFTVTESH